MASTIARPRAASLSGRRPCDRRDIRAFFMRFARRLREANGAALTAPSAPLARASSHALAPADLGRQKRSVRENTAHVAWWHRGSTGVVRARGRFGLTRPIELGTATKTMDTRTRWHPRGRGRDPRWPAHIGER